MAPQKDWAINKASGVAAVIKKLESVQADFDGNVSIADLIVLGGNAAIEDVSGINVPFASGRGDAIQSQTDVDSFEVLEPTFDGFRNYVVWPSSMLRAIQKRSSSRTLSRHGTKS